MTEKEALSDIFHKNKLSPKILEDNIRIAIYEYENLFNEKTYTEEQKLVKKIFNIYTAIQNVVQDLEKTLIFLRIEYKKILEIYPNLDDKKSYYIYHFENYFIRINTITDLIGKIGNMICKTNIDDEKCNGYNFKEKVKNVHSNIANAVEEILVYTKDLKLVRHKKIHTGKAEIENLKDIVLWSDLAKYTKDEYDSLLDDFTEIKLKEEIDRIENEIKELLKLTNQYFDLLEIEYNNL